MKKRILINGKKILNHDQLHLYLKHQFNLPEYYGNNLDALWDVLSHNKNIEKITVLYTDSLKQVLGNYGETFINLLKDLRTLNSIELCLFNEGRNNKTS